MTEHRESRIVPYTADLMFQVVSDIEHYPQFLPWVVALRLLSREENNLIAEMAVGYGPFRERYTSRVTLDPAARSIAVVAIKGPFRQLENHWRFTPENAGCRIDFSIQFEFASPLLQATASKAFEKVVLKMTDAFVARAAALT
ncbi:MAG TPA: type II toxin-antitoxin system RatA family toxin [Rhizomicrobium sp.]|nr:type II toxin-antitoxin system RatA family toxin [Rhizomicrobium sp.]